VPELRRYIPNAHGRDVVCPCFVRNGCCSTTDGDVTRSTIAIAGIRKCGSRAIRLTHKSGRVIGVTRPARSTFGLDVLQEQIVGVVKPFSLKPVRSCYGCQAPSWCVRVGPTLVVGVEERYQTRVTRIAERSPQFLCRSACLIDDRHLADHWAARHDRAEPVRQLAIGLIGICSPRELAQRVVLEMDTRHQDACSLAGTCDIP